MKKIITLLLLLFSFPFFIIAQTHQDTFYAKKYANMVEIDMKGLFSTGPGGSLLFRKKHESGSFVFVDRTRFWRLGLGIYANTAKQTTTSPNLNIPVLGSNYFGLSVVLGHETLFHFGKFGLYYAYDLSPNYYYVDAPPGASKTPCIGHTFGLGLAFSGGMRYFINNRFSVNLESTPFSTNFYFENIRYYLPYQEPFKVKRYGVSISQQWLRTMGFAYHF